MKREQVIQLFELLSDVYPNFRPNTKDETVRKVNTWTSLMKGQKFHRVMARAKDYVQTNRFPPTIADLTERVDRKNKGDFLEKHKQWQKEAQEVSTETKLEFRRKMLDLIKEKSK